MSIGLEDRADYKLQQLKLSLIYVSNILEAGGLEAWETKEFADLKASYEEKIKKLQAHVDYLNAEYGENNW